MSIGSLAALAACLVLSVPVARAAAIAQPLTPTNRSVAGNESADFSVRFLDAQGRPAAGESVQFANDACGWFPDGAAIYATTTDPNGVATARFTALNQGITCWLTASDGAQAQFNVLTYVAADAYVDARIPSRILPGVPFQVTAAALAGLYPLYEVDLAASIVPGAGSAAVNPSSVNSGEDGKVRLTVTPDSSAGDFSLRLRFRDRVQDFPVKIAANPWQDLWWAGVGENGWGMSVVQHGDVLFCVIYAYDANGKPTWFAMPGGSWDASHKVFSGALYRPHGTPYFSYDPSALAVNAAVGEASLDFSDASNVALSYTIDGVSGRKAIQRQGFGPVDDAAAIPVGDMWWGGPAQNGWGIAVLQQYRSLFAIWFTYDAAGDPTWYVMPSGSWSDAQTWQGRLYSTASSAWLGRAYDASLLHSSDVGPFRLRFSGDRAAFDYAVGSRSGTLALQRQPF
jgi:hypothetical protein